jgi:ATP-dependent DNA helicase RecQ
LSGRILRHFEGSNASSSSTLKERCCDNCTSALLSGRSEAVAEDKVDFTAEALLLLEAVRACGGKFGLGVPCDVLKGSKVRFGFLNELAIFGKGKHKGKEFWMDLGRCDY